MNNEKEQVQEVIEEVQVEQQKVEHYTNSRMKWLIVGNMVLTLASLVFAGYIYLNQPKVVSFDLKTTTKRFLDQISKLNVTEEQKQKIVSRYEKTLNIVIADYQKQNTLVLVKNAVVSSVDDRTGEIQREIAKRMQQQ